MPLAGPAELLVDRLEKTPDMDVDAAHPMFRVFADRSQQLPGHGAGGAVLRGRRGVAAAGRLDDAGVLARLRNGAPLVVERSFGKGRVVAFLTTAAPTWNNWARNPSFVVAMLRIAGLLDRPAGPGRPAARRRAAGSAVFGRPSTSGRSVSSRPQGDAAAAGGRGAAAADGQWLATLPATDRSGFYEARLTNKSTGKTESRHWAVNVDAAEGDLRALFGQELAARLQPEVTYQFLPADTFEASVGQQAGYNLGESLLYLLVARFDRRADPRLVGQLPSARRRATATAVAGRQQVAGGAA